MQINSNSCASAPVQIAGIEALTGPQDRVKAMVDAFDERRRFVYERLNAIVGFACQRPQGAFYAFPNITGTGLSSQEVQNVLLEQADVAVVSGTSFGVLGEGYIRISYAASLEELTEAMERMQQLFRGE